MSYKITVSAQLSFQEDLKLLLSAINEVENLFSDDTYDLYSLFTKCVVPEDVVSSTLRNLQERGEKQLHEFMKSRLLSKSKTISDTVTKNGVQFSA